MKPEVLTHAVATLRSGGVIAYPTESCFGLGCDPRNRAAVRRLLQIKRRSSRKGLILIADCRCRLSPFVETWDVNMSVEMQSSWPGAHTWLLPASRYASRLLCGDHHTLAVRVIAHAQAAQLCRLAYMPLVSTSANRSGRRVLRSGQAVLREFGDSIDYLVDGRIGTANAPSIIRDGRTGEVLRGG